MSDAQGNPEEKPQIVIRLTDDGREIAGIAFVGGVPLWTIHECAVVFADLSHAIAVGKVQETLKRILGSSQRIAIPGRRM